MDIPAWPQLSQRDFRENMYIQYSPTLPALHLDAAKQKVTFDTRQDITPALEQFYEHYLAEDLEYFALRPEYASGFFGFLVALQTNTVEVKWLKGQVTGPVSFGLTVTGQDLRASLYHELLADVIVKNLAMNARWQARRLKDLRPNVIIFVDEPYLSSFGSAYISISREAVIEMLAEVFEAIHLEGALAGVHCCGNTDWSLLMEAGADILNLDAYEYLHTLALYPHELRAFLDRGGWITWGIVPNDERVWGETPQSLEQRLGAGFDAIRQKAAARGVSITVGDLSARSLLAPCCGLGSTTEAVADASMDLLRGLREVMRQ